MSPQDTEHVFQKLREGIVPERGLEAFAVGVEPARREIERQMKLVQNGDGGVKFLRGLYGSGKTFMARLAVLDARAHNFATSFVVVSENDLQFHRFDDVYRKVVSELGTASCPRGALGDILDRWIGRVEEGLIAAGEDEDAEDFPLKVRKRLDEELVSLTQGKAPHDFIRVVQTIFDLKQRGKLDDAGALLSWLAGSENISASIKRLAGIKGDLTSRDALDYLRGILEIVKAAGYNGLVIVIDELETVLRARKDSRHKSLNGLRQICDASGSYPGLLWIFTGTAEFFESQHGVRGLAPLYDRIKFIRQGEFASLRQPQLELQPFNADRLRDVAMRLCDIYPARDRPSLDTKIRRPFIDLLVQRVSAGFRGDVGVIPRQFLREFVNHMDLVDEHPGYDPIAQCGFTPQKLTPEEQAAAQGVPVPSVPDAEDDLVPREDVW